MLNLIEHLVSFYVRCCSHRMTTCWLRSSIFLYSWQVLTQLEPVKTFHSARKVFKIFYCKQFKTVNGVNENRIILTISLHDFGFAYWCHYIRNIPNARGVMKKVELNSFCRRGNLSKTPQAYPWTVILELTKQGKSKDKKIYLYRSFSALGIISTSVQAPISVNLLLEDWVYSVAESVLQWSTFFIW